MYLTKQGSAIFSNKSGLSILGVTLLPHHPQNNKIEKIIWASSS